MRLPSLCLLAAVAALFAAVPAHSAEIGLNVNGGAAAGNNPQNFEDLRTLNARWARHFLDWDNFAYDRTGYAIYQNMLDQEEALGVKTLITIKSAGNTPPDPGAFAEKVALLAQNLKGVEAFEIWNEPELPMFWNGGGSPAAYVQLLKPAYAAVKRHSSATVVFAPTVGNNFKFVEGAYAAGAKGSFDAMAVHTDTACLDRSPGYFYREPDGRLGQYTFLGYREVHKVMQANGDGAKPIWMTEFGWSATTDRCEFQDKPGGVSEALQAQYLLEAMNCLQNDPFVEVAMWYNSRDLKPDGTMANMYGLRKFNGDPRPAFEAFRTWGAGGGRSSAPCGDFEGPTVEVLDPKVGFVLAPGTNLKLRARSSAPDLNRIWFRVEGPGADALFRGGPISLPDTGGLGEREWGGARELGNGQHKLIVWASDKNDNAGPVVVIPFAKGEPFAGEGAGAGGGGVAGGGPASFIQFRGLRLSGRGLRRTIRGGSLGVGSGAVRIEWQRKKGRRWVRYHGKTVVARRPFRVTQRLRRSGQWRVRALYLGTKEIKRTSSCWLVFHTRSTSTRLSCPRGAVRPSR